MKKYFLVSCHREENIEPEEKISTLIETLNEISKKYKMPIIFSTHPRTRKRIKELSFSLSPLIRMMKPLNFSDYNKLQICSKLVLSDSGTINEEASILGFNAVNIRDTHERPEAMEETATIMTGFNKNRIFQAMDIYDASSTKLTNKIVFDYNVDNVSDKVIKIIHSYTDFVNRNTWKKY